MTHAGAMKTHAESFALISSNANALYYGMCTVAASSTTDTNDARRAVKLLISSRLPC
jgi:hypothetical protein